MNESKSKLVTMTEAANRLGITRQAVFYHIQAGNVQARKVDAPRPYYVLDIDDLRKVVGNGDKEESEEA